MRKPEGAGRIGTHIAYPRGTIGVLLAGCFIWKLIEHKRKLAAALRAQQERECIADAATMREHTWTEPADIAADVTDPHLANLIYHPHPNPPPEGEGIMH